MAEWTFILWLLLADASVLRVPSIPHPSEEACQSARAEVWASRPEGQNIVMGACRPMLP